MCRLHKHSGASPEMTSPLARLGGVNKQFNSNVEGGYAGSESLSGHSVSFFKRAYNDVLY